MEIAHNQNSPYLLHKNKIFIFPTIIAMAISSNDLFFVYFFVLSFCYAGGRQSWYAGTWISTRITELCVGHTGCTGAHKIRICRNVVGLYVWLVGVLSFGTWNCWRRQTIYDGFAAQGSKGKWPHLEKDSIFQGIVFSIPPGYIVKISRKDQTLAYNVFGPLISLCCFFLSLHFDLFPLFQTSFITVDLVWVESSVKCLILDSHTNRINGLFINFIRLFVLCSSVIFLDKGEFRRDTHESRRAEGKIYG